MPQVIFDKTHKDMDGVLVYDHWHRKVWWHSPRVNGKLQLRANPFSLREGFVTEFNPYTWEGAAGAQSRAPDPSLLLTEAQLYDRCMAESYARFRGKLYGGSAALGVTLGSWKQSREMVVDRFKQLDRRADRMLARVATNASPRQIASAHLEIIFGWTPLLQDIHAATSTVIQKAIPKTWISASASDVMEYKKSVWVGYWVHSTGLVRTRVRRAAAVNLQNPNLWLIERAGLLNPASVAWDLVPWSFVVNMFVNTGQLVNSISDFCGLSFSDGTTTRSSAYTATDVVHALRGNSWITAGTSSYKAREKYRDIGAVERPPLVFKMPDVSWETAAMAASLFTQKFERVAKIIPSAWRARHQNTE